MLKFKAKLSISKRTTKTQERTAAVYSNNIRNLLAGVSETIISKTIYKRWEDKSNHNLKMQIVQEKEVKYKKIRTNQFRLPNLNQYLIKIQKDWSKPKQ
jgi:hypothetical protein